MQSTRRDGIGLPGAGWAPPWEYIPDPNPSPENPCVPAFFCHPTYDPTAAERPTAPQMDAP
eukprot:5336468-Pyramimonas_sp.AAC.1